MHSTHATHIHSHHSPNHQVALVTFQVEEVFDFAEWQFVMIEAEMPVQRSSDSLHISQQTSSDADSNAIHLEGGQNTRRTIKKPYSIASTSRQMQESKQISFVVKKASEDGMSHYLTQIIQPGNQITVKWPVWHYTDSLTHPNYLLISTGSGLSPNVGLFDHLVYGWWTYNHIINIYGERTHADIVPEIFDLFTQHGQDNIDNFFHLSREQDATIFSNNSVVPWQGEGVPFGVGVWATWAVFLPWRIQSSIPAAIQKLGTNTSCFLCGKPEMVDEVRQILMELWLEWEDITFEKY